jgi:hypothetical protein
VAAGSVSCAGGGGSAPVSASHFMGRGAFSYFSSVSGTTQTDIFIDAVQERASPAGSGAISGSIAFVQIAVYDTATGVQSVDAFGCTENPDFHIDQTLTAATLGPTVVTLIDSNSNTSSTATVSVDWTGIGDTTRVTQTSHFHSGNFTMTFHFTGFDRFADATGAAADPELNVSFGGMALQAELDKFSTGNVFVCVGGC